MPVVGGETEIRVAGERRADPCGAMVSRLPDGQITCAILRTASQVPFRKIFRLTRRANQRYQLARLTRQEGRLAIVTKRAVGCGGRGCAFDEQH